MSDEPELAPPAAEAKTRKPKEDPIPDGHVRVRVLPMGHGKVYRGDDKLNGHSVEERFPTYQRGDQFVLQQDIAKAQEDAGRVEILP